MAMPATIIIAKDNKSELSTPLSPDTQAGTIVSPVSPNRGNKIQEEKIASGNAMTQSLGASGILGGQRVADA
jgi:hypothetical protein